ncbi:MAG: MarR family transcriptional regulator [Polyangiaceae bacterium]
MPTKTESLASVIDETRRLFHRLANAAERLQADLDVTASERAVLEALARGSHTVPEIARSKGVSRQHIQTIVNSLASDDLVEARENPAHQRSSLLALTPAGERCFREIQKREQVVLGELAQRFRGSDLEKVAQTLKALGDHLEAAVARR